MSAFQSTGKEISADLCNRIIHTVENHPYYLQQFARNIWLISGKTVSKADFAEAKRALISENLNFYNELLDDLTSYQVGYLKALLSNETKLYSSANVRRMYKSLSNKGIIAKEKDAIVFADPIFKLIAEEKLM